MAEPNDNFLNRPNCGPSQIIFKSGAKSYFIYLQLNMQSLCTHARMHAHM